MNELAQSISSLYEPDSAPVVGVSGGLIVFCNSAARALFAGIEPGQRAGTVLPEAFLRCDEEVFVATARVDAGPVSASGVRYSGLLLLRLNLTPPVFEFSTEAFLAGMRTELAAIRIALERLEADSPAEYTAINAASIRVLRHSYYKLLQQCENTELAHNLANRQAVFNPLLMDPAAWLSELIGQMKEPVEKLGVKLQFTRPSNAGEIPADRVMLEHLVLNLVANALRSLRPGGSITFRMNRAGRWFNLSVDDSGPGFSEELLAGLYQKSVLSDSASRFRQPRMGMLIAWGVADRHGGCVTVTNRSRGGASVRITLPAEKTGPLSLREPATPYETRRPKNERVLTGLADVLPDDCYPVSI